MQVTWTLSLLSGDGEFYYHLHYPWFNYFHTPLSLHLAQLLNFNIFIWYIIWEVVRFLHREPVIYVFYFQVLNPPRWEIEEEN